MIPVIGSVAMGICSFAMYWAAARLARGRSANTGA
jgi:hypothetical protein